MMWVKTNSVMVSASSSRGFNATYQVNDCPDACFGNRACVSGECVCQEGWTGADCMTAICPNDCSQLSSYGTCNEVNNILYNASLTNKALD